MSDNLYQILGVQKTASQEDIRQAYRKLAKENHPDLNPGNSAAEERFKKISAAFGILGDEDKRQRYDRGEIDAGGQERAPQGSYRDYADADSGWTYHSPSGFADFADMGDIFSDLFEGAGSQGPNRSDFRIRGQDVRYHLSVEFLEAANGAKKRVTMPDGKTLDIAIPEGVKDGQVLRLKGNGSPGISGGPSGDALVELSVMAHDLFQRDGDDIRMDLPISLKEAVLGGEVDVPTVNGAVTMTLPKASSSGKILRLKGKGIFNQRSKVRGNQYVTLKVMLPNMPDQELEEFVAQWSEKRDYKVR